MCKITLYASADINNECIDTILPINIHTIYILRINKLKQ